MEEATLEGRRPFLCNFQKKMINENLSGAPPKVHLMDAFNFVCSLGEKVYPQNPQVGWIIILVGGIALWLGNDYFISHYREKREMKRRQYEI